jgi:hypothetical protein
MIQHRKTANIHCDTLNSHNNEIILEVITDNSIMEEEEMIDHPIITSLSGSPKGEQNNDGANKSKKSVTKSVYPLQILVKRPASAMQAIPSWVARNDPSSIPLSFSRR